MENKKNKRWVVCLKSKKEPIRVEAATVKRVNGQYVFTDESGANAGLYDVWAVEGYSVEPVATTPSVKIVKMVSSPADDEGQW